jgi:5'-nucleotidase
MRILISNDDGYQAPGLAALHAALSGMATTVVVAPDRDRSGASNSLTLEQPIRARTVENGFVRVEGTPTDCVHLAITGLLEEEPDMVVSGINAGANMGDDVLYSGTVAAATEGRFLGYPAIAVSMASYTPRHFATAGRIAAELVERLQRHPIAADSILNVNVPDIPYDELQGIQATRLATRPNRWSSPKIRVDGRSTGSDPPGPNRMPARAPIFSLCATGMCRSRRCRSI